MVSGSHQPVEDEVARESVFLKPRIAVLTWTITNPFPGNDTFVNGEWIHFGVLFIAELSLLNFVIQSGIEVGALLQVLRGVALGRADFFVGRFNTGTGGQCDSGGDGGRGDDGEDIEVHDGYLAGVCRFKS
jgi:hypothetical protein